MQNKNRVNHVRIALIIERIETWRGGAETSGMEIAQLLAQRDHDVHVFTTTNAQNLPRITIHTVPPERRIRSRRLGAYVRNTEKRLAAESFDIVHAVAPFPQADVYQPRGGLTAETVERNVATRARATSRLLKRALMAMNVKQKAQLDLERRIFRPNGPVIACVSKYVATQCERFYNVTDPRVRVVFNGVNPEVLDDDERATARAEMRGELNIADDTLLLVFLAHNFRLKGLGPLLEAAGRLVAAEFKNFHLVVAGRDKIPPYQRKLEETGLTQYVTFTGPTQRAPQFFAAADVCVHPTFYDPCSRVVLEALYHGVPAITTAHNGASEVITNGREGFVIDRADDVGMLARRIRDLADPAVRARMAENAKALRPRISMERHVEELEALFQEVRRRKEAPAG